MTTPRPRTGILVVLLSLVLAACSGGGAGGSSDGGGVSCSSVAQCPVYACACPNGASGSNAACANGVCASAEGACEDIGCHAASAGGPRDAAPPPTGDAGSPSGDAGSPSGPTVYCGSSDPNLCLCAHTADYGTTTTSCSVASLGGASVCCGTQGWPTQGTCSCTKIACQQYSSDTCICGSYTGTSGGPVVGSCSGMTCCKTAGAIGTEWCTCSTNLSQCLPGDTPVSSCGVADIGCQSDEATLSSCH